MFLCPLYSVSVFSTSVEVFPLRMYFSTGFSMSSPRPWRCFLLGHSLKRTGTVFSTSVEVFPSQVTRALEMRSLLHVRGGVSYEVAKVTGAASSSPRPWRCFSVSVHPRQGLGVFSTSVEVFPTHSMPFLTPHGLLHVRGGVSVELNDVKDVKNVFSTSVEVFLAVIGIRSSVQGLLHVRGGVSLQPMHFPQATVVFSTSVEVFPETAANLQRYLVFSTSVEVFLTLTKQLSVNIQSSPRPWRCFSLSVSLSSVFCVFSTSVEVFPQRCLRPCACWRLLHVRGGVSRTRLEPVR